ncbi:Hypothetical predicted protein [Octopus vulgaris]|uniref:Mos1 transposase HTH domain-containing protein n=1 Tax=Octopus vulgaris TaxID=6645 RepID=A0AA36F6W4_OCTVU|nr:Hypothetical predicted protein [Octopus vulgaris]
MDNQKFRIRIVTRFFLNEGGNIAKSCKIICEIYGDDAVSESSVRRYFPKFKAEEFSLEDYSRIGKPSKLEEDILKVKIDENSNIMTREIAEELEVSKTFIVDAAAIVVVDDDDDDDVVVVVVSDGVIVLVDFDTIISNAITSAIFSSNEMLRSLMSSYIG